MASLLYKIMPRALWDQAEAQGCVPWSEHDRRDGFVHLSSAEQVVATARRHFGEAVHLVLLALDEARLSGETLRWETSFAGQSFPHVYGDIPLEAVVAVHPLVDETPGQFTFPPLG